LFRLKEVITGRRKKEGWLDKQGSIKRTKKKKQRDENRGRPRKKEK